MLARGGSCASAKSHLRPPDELRAKEERKSAAASAAARQRKKKDPGRRNSGPAGANLTHDLTYPLSWAQYGLASGRICFGGLGFRKLTNSTRPWVRSVDNTESGLRRQLDAASRANSSRAGCPLLLSTRVSVTRPFLSRVKERTTEPWRP